MTGTTQQQGRSAITELVKPRDSSDDTLRCGSLVQLKPTKHSIFVHGITGTKKAALLQLFFKDGGEGGIMRWRAPLRGHRCAMLSRFARLEPTRVLTLPQAIAGIRNTKKAALLQLFFKDGGEGGIMR